MRVGRQCCCQTSRGVMRNTEAERSWSRRRRTMRWWLASLAFAAIAGLAVGKGDRDGVGDGGYLVRPTSAPDGVELLERGNALHGTIAIGEVRRLMFGVRQVDGQFPDVLLTLTVVGTGLDGDADLFCLPVEGDGQRSLPMAGPDAKVWYTNHSSGTYFALIPRDDPRYSGGVDVAVGEGGDSVRAAMFTCSVVGSWHSRTDGGGEFDLHVEVDYARKPLVATEREALLAVFENCCQSDSDCQLWRDLAPKKQATGNKSSPFLDFCHAQGSICNENGNLVRLNMRNFDLRCPLPLKQFGAIRHLEKANLGGNSLSGHMTEIAGELGTLLPNLRHLVLANNRISGDISSISICGSAILDLQYLDLRDNKIEGPLPACLFKGTIEELHLSGNSIMGGLPDDDYSRSTIRVLDLASTNLEGRIPRSIASLPSLQFLDLSRNKFTGSIPDELGSSKVLEFVNLTSNTLSGKVPPSFGASKSLKTLWLANNKITGIPNEWIINGSGMENLVDLAANENGISGEFPGLIATLPKLLRLDMSKNRLRGGLPSQDGLFPIAVYVNLSHNQFDGQIPGQWETVGMFGPQFANRTALYRSASNRRTERYLDLSFNNLAGIINDFLIKLVNTTGLEINLKGNDMECPFSLLSETIFNAPCQKEQDSSSDTLYDYPTHLGRTKDDTLENAALYGLLTLTGLVLTSIFIGSFAYRYGVVKKLRRELTELKKLSELNGGTLPLQDAKVGEGEDQREKMFTGQRSVDFDETGFKV